MDLFSYDAQQTIYATHELVHKLNHEKLEPEHLLYALINYQDQEVIRDILNEFKINYQDIQSKLTDYLNKKIQSKKHLSQVYLSSISEHLIKKAAIEKEELGHQKIDLIHIFIAMLGLTNQFVFHFLSHYGLTKKAVISYASKTNFEGMALDDGKKVEDYSSQGESSQLSDFCVDLLDLAKDNHFDPVIGRDEEVRRVIQALSRRSKNNPVLLGEPGVGKTAIVEELAQRMLANDVPATLKKMRLFSLDIGAMIAGAKYRGDFEDRLKGLVTQIEKSDQEVILFIDELHTIIGAGASEGTLDASNLLKPALARGGLRCIGATTMTEYKKYIEKDQALARRFQQIYVKEPSVDNTIRILRGLKEKYEVHHGVRIKDSALVAAVELSDRYITDRFLPDKAIDLIDEAASKIRIEIDSKPTEIDQISRKILQLEIDKTALSKETDTASLTQLRKINNEIANLKTMYDSLNQQLEDEREGIQLIQQIKFKIEIAKQKELEAQRDGDLETAARLKYGELDDYERKLKELNENMDTSSKKRLLKEEVDEEDIGVVVSDLTSIPLTKMLQSEKNKMLNIEHFLSEKVVGQEQAISTVSHAIRRARTGIQDPNRPLGSFLFVGTTGVGKTELVKALADILFSDHKAIVRIDMSEFMEKHSVSRLIGSPPGYVGYEEGGVLTEAIRFKPYSVVLFDEFEKGHPDIFNILLQILDEGRLTDSKGIEVSFKNTIVILTTNFASDLIMKYHKEKMDIDFMLLRDRLVKKFRPELLNRLDEIIPFRCLDLENIRKIVRIQLEELKKRLKNKSINLNITEEAEIHLAKNGFDPEFGARPLRRILQKELQDIVAYKILDGTIKDGNKVNVRTKNNKISLHLAK